MVETAFRETDRNTLNKQSQLEVKHQPADLARGGGGGGSFSLLAFENKKIFTKKGV